MTNLAVWLLLATAALTSAYALFLNRIHDKYAPEHIWITVVVGNALLGGMFALWLWLEPVPAGATFTPFWRLLALNVAGGIPIIAWQIGQNNVRAGGSRNGGRSDQDQGRPTGR